MTGKVTGITASSNTLCKLARQIGKFTHVHAHANKHTTQCTYAPVRARTHTHTHMRTHTHESVSKRFTCEAMLCDHEGYVKLGVTAGSFNPPHIFYLILAVRFLTLFLSPLQDYRTLSSLPRNGLWVNVCKKQISPDMAKFTISHEVGSFYPWVDLVRPLWQFGPETLPPLLGYWAK